MTLKPPCDLKLQQNGGDDRGRQLALPDQFVNRDRAWAQRLQHLPLGLIELIMRVISVI